MTVDGSGCFRYGGEKNERKKNEKKTKKNERTSLFSFEIIDIGFVSPLLKVLPLFLF